MRHLTQLNLVAELSKDFWREFIRQESVDSSLNRCVLNYAMIQWTSAVMQTNKITYLFLRYCAAVSVDNSLF